MRSEAKLPIMGGAEDKTRKSIRHAFVEARAGGNVADWSGSIVPKHGFNARLGEDRLFSFEKLPPLGHESWVAQKERGVVVPKVCVSQPCVELCGARLPH